MKQLESVLERKAVKLARDQGWKVKKLNTMFDNHWPDRMFIRPLKGGTPIFFVEFKRKGEKPTTMQQRVINDLKKRGHSVYVVDDYEKFCGLLRRHS